MRTSTFQVVARSREDKAAHCTGSSKVPQTSLCGAPTRRSSVAVTLASVPWRTRERFPGDTFWEARRV